MNPDAPIPGFSVIDNSSRKPVKLAMQRLMLTGRIIPVGARLVVRHEFTSQETKPVEAVYAFMLPRYAAMRRFRIWRKGFTVHSELKPAKEAIEAYEKGMDAGALSALAREYQDGLINLSVGNIRPGEHVTLALEIISGIELRDDGYRLRFPFTLAPSYHPKARAVTTEPGWGELELPIDEFGDLLLPPFAGQAQGLHQVGFKLSVDSVADLVEIGSPSHAIRVTHSSDQHARILLSPEADVPNRDLVLDVRVRDSSAKVFGGKTQDGKKHFAAVLPSTSFGKPSPADNRRIVFLLDRSGSMEGAPISQAKKAIEACLGALSSTDVFGIVVCNYSAHSRA